MEDWFLIHLCVYTTVTVQILYIFVTIQILYMFVTIHILYMFVTVQIPHQCGTEDGTVSETSAEIKTTADDIPRLLEPFSHHCPASGSSVYRDLKKKKYTMVTVLKKR